MCHLTEYAHRWAESFATPEELQQAVQARLLDPNPAPIGTYRNGEFPEDPIIMLLFGNRISDEQRTAIRQGWVDVWSRSEPLLEKPVSELDQRERQELWEPCTRALYIVEQTCDRFLKSYVVEAFQRLLYESKRVDPRRAQQLAAAALPFFDEISPVLWVKAMQTRPEIAMTAFGALCKIDRDSPDRLVGYLADLIFRQFVEGWDIDVWFTVDFMLEDGQRPVVEEAIRRFLRWHPKELDTLIASAKGYAVAGILEKIKCDGGIC